MNVVLLHAFPLGPEMWAPQRDALEAHDVIAPNLYDFGGNSVERWADRVLDQADGEFVAVGSSMGGYVALAAARRAPERVRGILLAGSRARADDAERRAKRNEGIRTIREEGIDAWAPSAPAPPPPERTVDELVRALEALRDRPDATDVVRSFEGPLWIVVGDNDPFLPVGEARSIADAAPNGRLELLEDTGHFPNIERRNRFNELLLEFLTAAA